MQALPSLTNDALLRLQTWLSPAFPVGGYAYSHGLEHAFEADLVRDRDSLVDWLRADLCWGSGRSDAMFFVAASRAGGDEELVETAELAAAMRGSAELSRESTAQGTAFLGTLTVVWPEPELQRQVDLLKQGGIAVTAPVAVALACRAHRIPPEPALLLYLQAWVANLVHAAVRLIPLGQTDGQRALLALEPAVTETTAAALAADPADLGSAALMVDWAAMRHETQTTRLFRS